MADYIDPITGQQENVFLNPDTVIKGRKYLDNKARNLTQLRMINNPEMDVEELYFKSRADVFRGDVEPNRYLEDEVRTYAERQTQAAYEAARNVSLSNPETIDASYDILTNIDNVREYFLDSDGMQKVQDEAYAPPTVADWRVKEEGAKRYADMLWQEYAEGDGVLDTVVDYASLLAPDYIKDINDIIGEGPFDSLDTFYGFVRDFQTRDPEEQVVLLDEIVPALWEGFDGNAVKVRSVLDTLFDRTGAGTSIAVNAAFDVIDIGDFATVGYLLGKGVLRGRSVATAPEDAGDLEEAARMQIIASAEDGRGVLEEATGITKVDAAHSANPFGTKGIDGGTSIDDVAANIGKIKEAELRAIEEDLLPVAGNKLDRGTYKALQREKRDLSYKVERLEKEIKVSTDGMSGLTTKARKLVATRLADARADINLYKERLDIVQRQIDANRIAYKAEADLSRLQQGIIPKRFEGRVEQAADKYLESLRARTEAIKERINNPAPRVPENATEAAVQAYKDTGVVFPKSAEAVTQQVDDLINSIITPEAFSPAERAFAMRKAKEKILEDMDVAGQRVDKIDIVETSDKGFKARVYTDAGESDRVVNYTRDDVGRFLQDFTDESLSSFRQSWQNLFGKVFSQDHLLERVFPDLVEDSTFIGQQAARIRNGLSAIWKDAEKGLSKNESFQVNSVLLAGDEQARVYDIATLRDIGIETTEGTVRLSDKQIHSYYQKRKFFDELHRLRDITTRRQLEIAGYENLSYTRTVKGKETAENLIGRRKKNFDLSEAKSTDVIFKPDDPQSNYHSVSWAQLNKQTLKEEGYEVVQLLEPFKVGEKEVKLALVRRDANWGALPSKVLNYQAGYVPRVYRRGYWYVRNSASRNQETLYAFETEKAAQKYIEGLKAEQALARQNGNPVEDEIIPTLHYDREFNAQEAIVEDSKAFGGLYTGSRKQRPLMVRDGENVYRPIRMSVGEATQRYVMNIANIIPMNEYRAATMERWKNTVLALGKAQGKAGLADPTDFSSRLVLDKNTKDVMEQGREYIKNVMGVASNDERVMERILMGAANMMYGKKFLEPLRNWTLLHSQGSVSNWIKGVSFDLHMGFYNIRQIFVQMQNSALAMSMNPQHALQAIGDALAMRTIHFLPEDKAMEAAKHLRLSDDIIESFQQFRKSGLREAISRQGDMEVMSGGIATQGLDRFRQLAKKGRIFFEEGENFSRLISWSIARRKWKAANPNKTIGDKDIIEISKDAMRMQMNMQAENAAWWQNAPGINIATQFLQVQAKFLENVMPRVLGGSTRWTPKEKVAAVTGQLFLYGTVGVPLAEEAVSYAAGLAGLSNEEFIRQHPNFTEQINEGVTGLLTSMMGAEDLAPSESFSILAGMDDNVVHDLVSGFIEVFNGGYSETGAVEMFSGPSANIIRRVGDVASGIGLSVKALYEMPTLDVAYGAILTNLDNIAGMTSTWSNARKLLVLHNTDNLVSSRGKLVASKNELGEMSLQTQLGIAMGFPTDVEVNHYRNKELVRSYQKEKAQIKNELKDAMLEYQLTGNEELFQAKKAIISAGLSPYERADLAKDVNGDIMFGKSDVERQLKAFQRAFIESGGRVAPTTAQSLLQEEVKD